MGIFAAIVCLFLQFSSAWQLQNTEQDSIADEQLQRMEEQGAEEEHPHFIIFKISGGAAAMLLGIPIGVISPSFLPLIHP